MSLDVSVPDPPSLSGPQSLGEYEAIDNRLVEEGDDYRREDLESILADGAWRDAFEEWARQTTLTQSQFDLVQRLHLIEAIDLYWDPAADEVGYQVPSITTDAAREYADRDPEEVELELDSLARILSEVLETDYLLRDDDPFDFFADDLGANDDWRPDDESE